MLWAVSFPSHTCGTIVILLQHASPPFSSADLQIEVLPTRLVLVFLGYHYPAAFSTKWEDHSPCCLH